MDKKSFFIGFLIGIIITLLLIGGYFFFLKEKPKTEAAPNFSQEELLLTKIRDYGYDMIYKNLNYTLGYLDVSKISNINDIQIKAGDKVDIYVYSNEIGEELSEIPWLSNVYVFMLKDDNDNTMLEKNDKLKTIYWVEPTYELEKGVPIRTIAEIPNYTIKIKVNNSEQSDEIKINKELDILLAKDIEIILPDETKEGI